MSKELEAAALALAESRRAAIARAHGTVQEPSPAPADAADSTLGEHGCVVLRELTTGGRVYPAGSIIPGDIVLTWKPANRAALKRQRRVAFFKKPIATPLAPTEGSA